MNCVDCGSQMVIKTENYRYDECGLPYVVLESVEVSRCPTCGAVEVAIPGVENVHRQIARAVANKDNRLTPDEVKFLRKYVGYSSADFAQVVGVDAATVSRWENGIRPVGAIADRLVRMLAMNRTPVTDYPIENLKRIDPEKSEPVRVELVRGEGEESDWQLATML